MRTTVDIPDSVYRQAKAKAAVRGETFKNYLINALRNDLKKTDIVPKKRLKGPLFVDEEPLVYTSEELSELLEGEDRAILG